MTEQLTVWTEISRAFEQIGEPEIRRVQRSLGKMTTGEAPLGVIHNEGAKRLWALADRFEGEAQQAAIDSAHKADTEEQAEELKHRALRCAALEEIARDLFWTQAKDDIGAWGRSGSICLREDWMLTLSPEQRSPLAEILGGLIRRPE